MGFVEEARKMARDEPKKLIHCFRVGTALCLVSLFYYMNPLYQGFGQNVMWAVLTVAAVFEYTVGATICKCLNRAVGTVSAGALAAGVHSAAVVLRGKYARLVLLQLSLFIIVWGVTFLRFAPSVRAQFDHGAVIFLATFTLVSVSGYRTDTMDLFRDRMVTIGIGVSMCIVMSMAFWPVWAGNELHNLIKANMEKLSRSLDASIAGCFDKINKDKDDLTGKRRIEYDNLLDSKAAEESLANFARWEPVNMNFCSVHPWKEYLKLGDSIRSCARIVDALDTVVNSETWAPNFMKDQFSKICVKLASNTSSIMKELVYVIDTKTKPPEKGVIILREMINAGKELQCALKALSQPDTEEEDEEEARDRITFLQVVEIVPLMNISYLLIEIAARTEKISEAVVEVGKEAKFRVHTTAEKSNGKSSKSEILPRIEEEKWEASTSDVFQNV